MNKRGVLPALGIILIIIFAFAIVITIMFLAAVQQMTRWLLLASGVAILLFSAWALAKGYLKDQTAKTIVIIFLLAGVGLIAWSASGLISQTVYQTPIFCNDYEFTCCSIYEETIPPSPVTSTLYFECNAMECTISSAGSSTWWKGSQNCRLEANIFGSYMECDDGVRFQTGVLDDYKLYEGEILWTALGVSGIDIYGTRKNVRLVFCGRSGGCGYYGGVPVLGADRCKFPSNQEGKIYSEGGSLIKTNAAYYSVATEGTCVLAWQRGDEHLCGYKEETCTRDSDCGGHTYGNQECYARTLQTYGCVEYGTPVGSEIDRFPWESGWGSGGDEYSYGKSCEQISAQQVQCCGDTDCATVGENMFCDTSTFTCKQEVVCTQDVQCGTSIQCDWITKQLKKPVCRSGQCTFETTPVDCCIDNNCPENYYCTASRECAPRTENCYQCPYECCYGECVSDGGYFDKPCPSNAPFCVNNRCQSESECNSDADCPPEKPTCENGICIQQVPGECVDKFLGLVIATWVEEQEYDCDILCQIGITKPKLIEKAYCKYDYTIIIISGLVIIAIVIILSLIPKKAQPKFITKSKRRS